MRMFRLFLFKRQLIAGGLLLLLIVSSCTLPVDPCSTAFLVNAINGANATPATIDVIDLSPSCLYELDAVEDTTEGANGLPSITSPIIINGNAATIRRSLSTQKMALRLFHISAAGSLTLNNVTLLDGLGMNPPDVSLATLNYGGAIYNNGQLSINNSTLLENRAALRGGAIFNAASGTMVINNTTLSGNQAALPSDPGEHGGAIYNQGTATISNTTFVNNTTGQTGGAVANGGTMYISNSTFSANTTTMLGGSAIDNFGTMVIEYTTIAFNTGGVPSAALLSATDTLEIRNSIISNNTAQNCSYPATSAVSEENISDDGSCDGFTILDDPQLDPLAGNGGPTQTHAIAPSSPAKNAATGSCLAADQRGQSRPHGPSCDLGAFEFSSGAPPPATDTPLPGGSISGWTYIDANDNGIRDAAEASEYVTGAILTLAEGACPGTTTLAATESSVSDGSYSFIELAAGTYCVLTSELQQTLLPASQTVIVGAGEAVAEINFRFVPSPMPTITPTLTSTATFSPTYTFTPIPPTATSTPVSKGPSATDTPVVMGQIYVYVWQDVSDFGVRNKGEPSYPDVMVFVGHGACDDRAAGTRTGITDAAGMAHFPDLPLTTYCVYTEIVEACSRWSYATTPSEVTVVVDGSGPFVVNFGFAIVIC